MKKNFYRNLACMLIFTGSLCMSTNTEAQVTVGSKGVPNQGALLDMKQEDKADGSANSKKGLGLPRVALTAVDKLDPCVATTGIAATDDAAKKSHIGLTVYNTTDNTAGAATLSEGVYAWDGAMWTQYSGTTAGGAENGLSMSGKKVILGGPLNRPTTITGDATNNLTLNTPTSVGSTLGVTGATTLGSTLGVSGVTSLRNTNVTGNLTVSANTKTATSTVTGNETVGGTLVVTGATTTKATNVTGVMKYTNTTPVVGQYLSAINTDGTVAWTTLPTLPSTATNTEPWRVQGGMVEATLPTDATFVTGNVAIGSNTSAGNKLQVTGNTNIIGNSVVSGNSKTATSTVTGNETVGGTLGVTGATTLNDVTVGTTAAKKTATVNGNLIVSGDSKTATSTVTGNETVGGTLGVTGVTTLKTTNVTENLTVSKNTKTATSTVTGNESVGGSATIGMNTTTPTVGALLEIRNKQQDLTGVADVLDPKMVTSDKGGLLLPRVKLVNLSSLEPFITNADAKTKLSLAGLMVYNIAVVGDKIYPAFYVWSGTSWDTPQQSASTLVIDNSVSARVKPFTFYELGTETTTSTPVKFEPLKVTVSGAFGTPTYQWYQVTGNNVHVRAGSKIIGATSAEFYPVNGLTFDSNGDILTSESILKGSTRNSKNTGFYRYYCIVKDNYREVESETVEVAVGCGAKNKSGEWISFMCYNLGAENGTTIEKQMKYPIPIFGNTNNNHTYIPGEEKLYGDLYQWGRVTDGHEKRTSTFISSNTNSADLTASIGNGEYCATDAVGNYVFPNYPYLQVSPNKTTWYGKFIGGTTASNFNWLPTTYSNMDMLWSNAGAIAVANDPCQKLKADGTFIASWNTVKLSATSGAQSSTTGACAQGAGWRMMDVNDWDNIYTNGLKMTGSLKDAVSNTWEYYRGSNTNYSTGIMIKPDNIETTLYIPFGGNRASGSGQLTRAGDYGYYWTTTVSGVKASYIFLSASSLSLGEGGRDLGNSIRCVKK